MLIQNLVYRNNNWSKTLNSSLDSENTFILVFQNPKVKSLQPLIDLQINFPKSKMIGCSTAGEIHDTLTYDDSITVTICKMEKTQIKTEIFKISSDTESFKVGQDIIKKLNQVNLKAIIFFTDGLNINGHKLAEGISTITQKNMINIQFVGGMAGDNSDFQSTFQIDNSAHIQNSVVALAFYGTEFNFSVAYKAGWKPFGIDRTVTKSVGNKLFELNQEPALDIYKKYLGPQSEKLPASALLYPLSIKVENQSIVRTVLKINETEKSMTFAGDIPEGSTAQLMHADYEDLINAAKETTISALQKINLDKPVLAIAVSCVGRKLLLGLSADREANTIYKSLPQGSALNGFFSYGEFATNDHDSTKTNLHNQTLTLALIQE